MALDSYEQEVFDSLSAKINNDIDFKRNIMAAELLLLEIENKYGFDVLMFITGYIRGLFEVTREDGQASDLEVAGEMASFGYGEFQSRINDALLNARYEKTELSIELKSEVESSLNLATDAINKYVSEEYK